MGAHASVHAVVKPSTGTTGFVGYAAIVSSGAQERRKVMPAELGMVVCLPSRNPIPRELEGGPEVQCHLWLLQ